MDATTNDPRRDRGMVIAATMRLKKLEGRWFVPSQTMSGYYVVRMDQTFPHCTCPDYELRQIACKHIFAVEITRHRETAPDGSVTERQTMRVTYAQNWPAYNTAQTTEKAHFCRLLRDLCNGVPEPEQTRGRPRLPLGDMLFAAGFKVYSTVSARRFMTDLREACASGYLQRTPHYNSIFNYLESESLTPLIHDMITESSLPLREIETTFAVDSTGFGLSRYFNHYNARYGHDERHHEWLKLHAMVGVKTNVITSVTVTDKRSNDSPQLVPLVAATARNFAINEVTADKAYNSRANLDAVDAYGATAYIPFKTRSRGDGKHALWNKLYHLFAYNRETWLGHYHQRSNVEATFSMIKRVFGDSLRSKTPVAQVNEVLLKVLCHNIRCLVHAMHELDITPMLGQLAAH